MNSSNASANPAREDRILAAAASLIAHYGYDKTTIDDIAREAGVSKGAIYLHWRSRDELFDALLKREFGCMMDDFLARVAADPEGGSLFSVYRHALLALAQNPVMRALYSRDNRVLGDYMRKRDPAIYRERSIFSLQYTRSLQAAGLIRQDLPAEVVNYILVALTVGLLNVDAIVAPEQAPPLEEVGEALADMIRRALAPAGQGDNEKGRRAMEQMLEQVRVQWAKEREARG